MDFKTLEIVLKEKLKQYKKITNGIDSSGSNGYLWYKYMGKIEEIKETLELLNDLKED